MSSGALDGTVLGALTGTFTPTPTCQKMMTETWWISTPTRTVDTQATGTYSYSAGSSVETVTALVDTSSTEFRHYYAVGPTSADMSGCFPSGYTPDRDAYFSPATACPVGYTIAASGVSSSGSVTETSATCCPSQLGTNQATTLVYQPTLGCTSAFLVTTLPSVTSIDASGATVATAVSVNGGALNAYSIQIRWQASDMTSSPASSTFLSAESAATSTSSSTSTTQPRRGLSSGTAAGIGVGVAIVVLAFGIGAFMLFWRRRTRRLEASHREEEPTHFHAVEGISSHRQDPNKPGELEGHAPPLELSAGVETPRYAELP